MTTAVTTLAARRSTLVVVGALVLVPLAVLLVRLLPADGAGLALRLAVAGACVFVLPGALVVRALGAPTDLALATAAALGWSLLAVFVALTATFALDRSLRFTLGVLVAVCVVSLVASYWRRSDTAGEKSDHVTVLCLVAAGLAVGAVVWWAAPPISGDAIEHLGRVRKLEEMPRLESVRVSEMFREGNPHPGYAFPLWHGGLALVARVAAVDTSEVMRLLPALLTPLLFVVTYAAGAALFRSRWGGLALLAGQLALWALPPRGSGLGLLETVSGPAHATLLILASAVLALTFAFIESGQLAVLASVAAASFAFTVIHPSYAPFIALMLGGFAIARLLLAPEQRRDATRCGLALGAVLVPAGLFLAWLVPSASGTEQVTPDAAERQRQITWYSTQLDIWGDVYRFAPHAITAAGALAVAGLLAVPLAFFARRTRWAAFVLGTTLPILAVLLVPPLFMLLADLESLSQARRLSGFLPLSFAFAGAAVVLGGFRFIGVAVGLVAGLALQLLYPGEFTYHLVDGGGPRWPVWLAAAGGVAALAAATVARRRRGSQPEPSKWTAFVALGFVAPILVLTLPSLDRGGDTNLLSRRFVKALRTEVPPGDVVLADERTSYRAMAYAPIYVAASEHAWDRPYDRIRDVEDFFSVGPGTMSNADRRELLDKYGATWVVVDRTKPAPQAFLSTLEPVYEGRRLVLYRVPPDLESRR